MEYKKYINKDKLPILEVLDKKKKQLLELKSEVTDNSPFVIEISGLPRTGKTTSFNSIYDFFNKGGFNIKKGDEPAFLLKESLDQEQIKKLSSVEFNDKTLEISRASFQKAKNTDSEIILMDRGIIDNYFWYQLYYNEKEISDKLYDKYLECLYKDLLDVDVLFTLTANIDAILDREYNNSIYLESRKKTNAKQIEKLHKAYKHLEEIIKAKHPNLICLDTTKQTALDTSISIALESMIIYEKKLSKQKN